jgi:hypothetical protein
MNKELFFKVTDRLNEINKALESNFLYQLSIVVLFYFYYEGRFPQTVSILGLSIPLEQGILWVALPAVLLYLLCKMAVLMMAFIELSETFFTELNKTSDGYEKTSLRSFLSNTIFLAIPLIKFTYRNWKISRGFLQVWSSLLYAFPGMNMALVLFTIVKYQKPVISIPLAILATLSFAGFIYEYYNNKTTRKYSFLAIVSFISCLISFTLLAYYVGLHR